MRKLFLLFAFLSAASTQAQNFYFSQTTGRYTPITGATNLASNGWDDEYIQITLPFSFSYDGVTNTVWYIDTYGGICDDTSNTVKYISGLFCDFEDRANQATNPTPGMSPIYFQVSGTAPNRVATVEFKNAGFYDGDATEFANFQIKLFENNNIEYHFGASSISPSTTAFSNVGPFSGVIFDFNVPTGYFATGDPALPYIDTITASSTNVTPLDSLPPAGMIYRWSPNAPTSVRNLKPSAMRIYPNPVRDLLTVNLESDLERMIQILDVTGKVLLAEKSYNKQTILDVSALPAGMYSVVVTGKDGVATSRFIRQ